MDTCNQRSVYISRFFLLYNSAVKTGNKNVTLSEKSERPYELSVVTHNRHPMPNSESVLFFFLNLNF